MSEQIPLNFAAATKLRRLNTTSLALDACDALQRPVAGETELRLVKPSRSLKIMKRISPVQEVQKRLKTFKDDICWIYLRF